MEDHDIAYWNEIDAYIKDRLNETERQEFERKLKQDPQLEADLDLQRKLIKGMAAYDDKQDFLSILDKIDAKQEGSTSQRADTSRPLKVASRSWLRPALAIAASLAVLLFALWWLFLPTKDYSALADQYFEWSGDIVSSQLSGSGMVGTTAPEDLEQLKSIIQDMNSENLEASIQTLRGLQETFPSGSYPDVVVDFYLAQALLKQGDHAEAIRLLQPLSELEGLPIMPHIRYYLALAQLKAGQTGEARRLLNTIPDDHGLAASKRALQEELD